MLTPAEFRDVVSGRRTGGMGVTLRSVLGLIETPYRLAVDWRNRRYDRGVAVTHRVGVPVVSVGNLTLGGTGKTPLVKWIARWFAEHGVRVAIASRGYKAAPNRLNDEALELAMSLPGVPQIQNPDRVAAARKAVNEHQCEVILLDDGFQHRRLARDSDIVLLDALEPFGFEHVFPRGTLREPLAGLRRAQVVCLSRSDLVTPDERSAIRQRVAQLVPKAAWCEVAHAPIGLVDVDGRLQPINLLRGRRVAAFCGIGNPAGFRQTLAAAGAEVVSWREFPDHHAYAVADFAELGKAAASARAELVICTQKDLVKLGREPIAGQAPLAVAIEIEFREGRAAMEDALRKIAVLVASHHLAPGQ